MKVGRCSGADREDMSHADNDHTLADPFRELAAITALADRDTRRTRGPAGPETAKPAASLRRTGVRTSPLWWKTTGHVQTLNPRLSLPGWLRSTADLWPKRR